MKRASLILTISTLIILTSCDPVHDLKLENKTNKKIDVIYSPMLDQQELEGQQATEIKINGRMVNLVTLDPTKTIRIGHVSARYNPKPSDIHLDYLEIRIKQDTLKLVGQNAIFSTLQKVDKLDWRVIIRTE
jgi:hypothetical protein